MRLFNNGHSKRNLVVYYWRGKEFDDVNGFTTGFGRTGIRYASSCGVDHCKHFFKNSKNIHSPLIMTKTLFVDILLYAIAAPC